MGLNLKNQTRSEKKLLKVVILSYLILAIGSPQMDTVSKLVSANLSLYKKPFICDRMQMSIS